MIPTTKYDTDSLTIPAGQDVSIEVINEETDVPHNLAIFQGEDGEDILSRVQICDGPCAQTVTINLPAGEYQFRCEVHSDQMIGHDNRNLAQGPLRSTYPYPLQKLYD